MTKLPGKLAEVVPLAETMSTGVTELTYDEAGRLVRKVDARWGTTYQEVQKLVEVS